MSIPTTAAAPSAAAPTVTKNLGEERNRRVVLSAMRSGVTKTGKPALFLEDTEGRTVARLQLDTEAFSGGSSQYACQKERTVAILDGLGVRDSNGIVHPDRIAGLEVDVLEACEEYEGQMRWSAKWINLPREKLTAAFNL